MKPLFPRLPAAAAGPDAALSEFLAWVADNELELYPAQEEALLELSTGKHCVLATPTGSGKSMVATFLHFMTMAAGGTTFYTCPIKALVNEKFFALCEIFGADNVAMMTGDAAINTEARGPKIVCCTAEILANQCLREGAPDVQSVVMDEFHYYADKERGIAWQIPLLLLEKTQFLLMSATLGDVTQITQGLLALTGRETAEVRSRHRPVPLDFVYRETPLHETIAWLFDKGRAPIYLVNFTQRSAAERAQDLMSLKLLEKSEKDAVAAELHEVRFDTPYGKELSKFLRAGIGLHHAGLLPKYRLTVEKLAQKGLLKVVSGTDTLGMGVNIPIRTVLFTQLCKYDGEKTAVLSVRDFLQISGRAGRKGFDELGTVCAQAPEHVIENLKLADKKASGKKVVLRQAPTKGYAHWDRQTFERLQEKPPEPLESRFDITHGLLLNLLQAEVKPPRGGGYRRLTTLIGRAHTGERGRTKLRRQSAECFRTLRAAGIVGLKARRLALGGDVEVNSELQRDFSLNQTLSLYLVDTLKLMDPTSPTYALDVLTLVESILEEPTVVLYAQLDALKTAKMAEMKLQGMEFAERIEELDKMEWPKPNRDFIYDTFNAFSAKHPWIAKENIRPKSVARDMVERWATFNEYVREYGLERSEGILLRYLSECYKTMAQTVPEVRRTDEVHDVITHLWNLLREVDTSLIDEWERLRDGSITPIAKLYEANAPDAAVARARDLAADPRALGTRVRGELHRLLRALATKSYDEAVRIVRPAGAGDEPWSAQRIEAELAPYWAVHDKIVVTPAARSPAHTTLTPRSSRVWDVTQRLVDPEGNEDFAIHATVALDGPVTPDEPLLELRRIGV